MRGDEQAGGYACNVRDTDIVTGRYLAEKVRDWLRANPKSSQAALAKKAGLSTAQISILLSTGRGVGRKTLRGLGRVFGMTPDSIEAEAAAWGKTIGVAQQSEGPEGGRPHLESAIRMLLTARKITRQTAEAVRAMNAPIDLDEETWLAVLLNVERRKGLRNVA